MADYAKDVLVDTQWVQDHLDDDSIRIVEVDENPALYAEAHIPGAIGFDWQKDLQDQVKRDFLGPRGVRRAVRLARRSRTTTRSCSTATATTGSPPTRTGTCSTTATTRCKLMNGPREKWIEEGRPTSTDVPSHPATTFEASGPDERSARCATRC